MGEITPARRAGADARPRALVLSHVLPLRPSSGQQQRVAYTLEALRARFHVTFVTVSRPSEVGDVRAALAANCDAAIVFPSRYSRDSVTRAWQRGMSVAYSLWTGLKRSNYVVGRLEFSPARAAALLESLHFDLVLFEYWHAAGIARIFRRHGVPCVLDMHNILWRAYRCQLDRKRMVFEVWKRWSVSRYRYREQEAWNEFDGIIAINAEEEKFVRGVVSPGIRVFYTPMGIDLYRWPYCWAPVRPVRVAFYGGLGSAENREAVLRFVTRVMPRIWERLPETEAWLVGSGPPPGSLFPADPRVNTTGYVETQSLPEVLKTMSLVVCPWSGTYGFRSRLIEVMATGVPVVASTDAVYGMDLDQCVVLGNSDDELGKEALHLLEDRTSMARLSRAARSEVERRFSMEHTYGRLGRDLQDWLKSRKVGQTEPSESENR